MRKLTILSFRLSFRLSFWFMILASLLGTGCQSKLPVLAPDESRETFSCILQQGTPELWDQLYAAAEADGRPRVALVERGDEALALRVNLIRGARKSVKILTFIWEDCEVTRLAEWELCRAVKQRDIDVRIVSDAFSIDPDVKDRAREIEGVGRMRHRMYAPLAYVVGLTRVKLINALLHDFRGTNRRMHTKLMIVDDRIAITGGRNWGNKYFDQHLGMNFRDRDVVIVGPVVAEAVEAFEGFWDSERVIPSRELLDVSEELKHHTWHDSDVRADFKLHGMFKDIERAASDPAYIRERFVARAIDVEKFEWAIDHPIKGGQSESGIAVTTHRYFETIDEGNREVLIQTPYLVLDDSTVKRFQEFRSRHPDARVAIVTNGLANTDQEWVYAAIYKQTRILLEDAGVEVYQMKPVPEDIKDLMAHDNLIERRPTPEEASNLDVPRFAYKPHHHSSYPANSDGAKHWLNQHTQTPPFLTIHAKSAVIDNRVGIVGSFNLDPRSQYLNTEIMVIIHDERFARRLAENIRRDMHHRNSYILAPHRFPLGLERVNEYPHRLFEILPLDIWPIRHGGLYRLKPGGTPLPVQHEEFHKHYEPVGDFPEVKPSTGAFLRVWFFKTIGNLLEPFL